VAIWESSVVEGQRHEVEFRLRRNDGVYHWHVCRGVPLRVDEEIVSWFGVCTDVDAQKRTAVHLEEMVRARTAELQAALREKTVLVREVHHRVKNNMAVISGLLGQQAHATSDPAALGALEECERRVHAMALVHECLYATERLDRINFRDYIEQLSAELYRSCVPKGVNVTLRLAVDPVEVGVHTAIPCGLILNELLTNAFKYAFPERTMGDVMVGFHRDSATGEHSLIVQDDGVGMPEGLDWQQAKPLGLRIVQILAKQLDGTIGLEPGTGARFVLRFPGQSPDF
jgi:two-component sensor histidine kinase